MAISTMGTSVNAAAMGMLPMAAAFTLVPIVLIAVYLSIVKRLGAFDAL